MIKCWTALSLLLLAVITEAAPSRYEGKVYIGQAYPSGNVYLEPLTRDPIGMADQKPGPASVHVIPLGAGTGIVGLTAKAAGRVEGVYIPELERLAEKSDPCSPPTYQKAPELSYAKTGIDDYFDRGTIDNCKADYSFRYTLTEKPKVSFPVVALNELKVNGTDYSVNGKPRAGLAKFKPTKENYKDAKAIVRLTLAGKGNSIIISRFTQGGEAHWGETYLLDVIENSVGTHTFAHHVGKGAL